MAIDTYVINAPYLTGRAGSRLEIFVIDKLADLFGSSFKPATKDQDCFLGTDCYIERVPVDITLRHSKDHSIPCGTVSIMDELIIHVSARFGNRHVTFKEPVMVLQFCVDADRFGMMQIESWLDVPAIHECIDLFFAAIPE